MADIRDEHGNPVKLTDELGNPVRLTDERGNPVNITGVATTQTSTSTGQQHGSVLDTGRGVSGQGGMYSTKLETHNNIIPTTTESLLGDKIAAHDHHHHIHNAAPTTHLQQRSGSISSSSSSSEDDGQGGRRKKIKKKGLTMKIKEKIKSGPSDGKHPDHNQDYKIATSTTATTITTIATQEHHHDELHKKTLIDKIKEKLPGHHH